MLSLHSALVITFIQVQQLLNAFSLKVELKQLHHHHPSTSLAPSSTWLLCRDHILLQINENSKLLQDENSHNVAALLRSLKPWIDLDHQKGSTLVPGASGRPQPESLWEVAELLLERKNRVWGRVFIQSLSGSPNTSPRLHDWALSAVSLPVHKPEQRSSEEGGRGNEREQRLSADLRQLRLVIELTVVSLATRAGLGELLGGARLTEENTPPSNLLFGRLCF